MATDTSTVDRVRALFAKDNETEYAALHSGSGSDSDDPRVYRPVLLLDDDADAGGEEGRLSLGTEKEFSKIEYGIFMLLGVAMLWAWNMFLAAAPYFQTRFADNTKILASFQPAITSVACVTNLGSMLILQHMQKKANYPRRIIVALIINVIVFTILAISTTHFRDVSSMSYLIFTLIMVFATSTATGLIQNGAFAFAAGFGPPEYMNAIVTGNAIAGVLPALASIISVLAVPAPNAWATISELEATTTKENKNSAFIYFLTATVVSGLTIFAFVPLVRKHNRMIESQMEQSMASIQEAEEEIRKVASLWTLWKKLRWIASALFMCFAVTMFFPVLTPKVLSVIPEDRAPRLLQASAFIPLGFLVWNVGDLAGRLFTMLPFRMRQHPVVLFTISILRVVFIPAYLLCNIQGKGAVINSDVFYLFVVQFGYGFSNGWLGSCCLMQTSEYVEEGEREAAGGFMILMLVAGLTTGSLLSFSVAGVS